MQENMNDRNSTSPRRTFLKSAGAAAAGLYMAGAPLARAAEPAAAGTKETLAVKGGPKAVTVSDQGAARWPQYGADEEAAVLKVIRSPNYEPNATLEQDWKDYFKVPYAKAYCNGTSALTTMFFALNLPAGSEIMVPQLHVLRHDHAHAPVRPWFPCSWTSIRER